MIKWGEQEKDQEDKIICSIKLWQNPELKINWHLIEWKLLWLPWRRGWDLALFQIASCTTWRTHLGSILSKHRIYHLTSFSGIIVKSKLRIVCIIILEINWKHLNVNELLKNQKFWKKMPYWELLITQTSCWCLVFFISTF